MHVQPRTSRRFQARAPRLLLRLLFLVVVAAVGLELTVRFLLFSPSATSWPGVRRLRDPGRFAHPGDGDRWFALRYLWAAERQRDLRPPWAPNRDDLVGWTSDRYAPGSYFHSLEGAGETRQRVLLFGDSFAAGVGSPESRFEALLEAGPAARTHVLLNYGTPGFGLDQVLLLAPPVLDLYPLHRPHVVVGFLVDDDLDRCLLSFREWPKPRFEVEDGRLVPFPAPTIEAYFAERSDLPASYALALLRTAVAGRPTMSTPSAEAKKQELARLILAAMVAELRSHDVCFVFVLFNKADSTIDPQRIGWRQDLVRQELARLDAPWVEVRDELLRASQNTRRDLGSYFRPDGHLNDAGNKVALETILRGLARCGVAVPPPLWSFDPVLDAESGGLARWERSPNLLLPSLGDGPRLLLRGGAAGPTRITYRLDGLCRAWRCGAWCFDPSGKEEGLELVVEVDGDERWRGMLTPGGERVPVQVDLTGADELVLWTPARKEAGSPACLVLADPVIE